jgi:hypothetical protein
MPSLIHVLIVVLIVGMLVWLVQSLPIQDPFKTILLVVVVIIGIVALLPLLGIPI